MTVSPLTCTIDLEQPGKSIGILGIPYSYNLGGWAQIQIPICVLNNGSGPSVLAMAGNHGDEYPGQVALLRLIRELSPEQIQGRLIIIPALSVAGSKASTRLNPIDGKNFNRCFPGKPDGTPSEMLAHYLSTVLFPMVDVVIDLHTGGRSMDFYPCAHMHLVPDPDQRRKMFQATEAYLTDFCFLYADIAGTGLLPVEAERQGKVVVTTEMGGGEVVTAATHRLSQTGLANVLRSVGVLEGNVITRESLGKPAPRWVQALISDDYRFAPVSGIYENLVDLGAEVSEGVAIGQIFTLERPADPPVQVVAKSSGILLGTRGPSMVAQGDCVGCIAQEVDPRIL